MSRVALLLAPAAAAAALPAAAQTRSATTSMPVVGSAPQICVLQPPRLAPGAQVNFRGLSGETLQIDQMVDSTTLAANAASASVQFDAVCSFPHRLRIESQNNGLWRTSELAAIPSEELTVRLSETGPPVRPARVRIWVRAAREAVEREAARPTGAP